MPQRGKQESCRLGLSAHSTCLPLCGSANAYLSESANSALSQLCWVPPWEQTVSYVKLGVKSCWDFVAWTYVFWRQNWNQAPFPLGAKCIFELWCSYRELTILPLPPPLPTLWNSKTDIVSQMAWTNSLPKSHDIYGMTRIRNLPF